ncbi:MAG: hypothetical protein D6696_15545 [Acidobacteria bacterium]|nr:MAG: hypothetical protein D6696_15545 [Acidobacteriota bacterium]
MDGMAPRGGGAGGDRRTLIGWREYVELPEWGVSGIVAKADTGARSSAVDVERVVELPGGRVRFALVADRRHAAPVVVEADVVRRSRVRSSFGDSHERIFVATTLRCAGHELTVELGLVSRHAMRCRMLLGRKTLEHVFLVDPGRCYLHGRKKRRLRRDRPTGRPAPPAGDRAS